MRPITLLDVKVALKDGRFREILPAEIQPDVDKYLQNPSCACNMPIYKRVLKDCAKELKQYYPNREISNLEEVVKLPENHFSVINCHKDDLESKLKKMPPGKKQVAVCRWEDQITVIINELDYHDV